MKKIILPFTFLVVLNLTAFAQNQQNILSKMSIGLDAGIPFSNQYENLNNSSSVFGADVKFDVHLVNQTALTFSFGYSSVTPKHGDILGRYATEFLPLKVGVKRRFDNFYAEVTAGYLVKLSDDQNNRLIYGGGLGYYLTKDLDLGLRYEGWRSFRKDYGYYAGNTTFVPSAVVNSHALSQIALRLAYTL